MRVEIADWVRDNTTIRHLRYIVFVEEQQVPLEIEIDGRDPQCHHVLAYDDQGVVVGTGRMQQDGKIGRMAVLAEARNGGVGGAILAALMGQARTDGLTEVYLHAQKDAIRFYEKHGFVSEGERFVEADIEHLAMRRAVAD